MKYVLSGVALLLGVLVLGGVALYGQALPVQYKLSRAARYETPTVEQVWEKVQGIEDYPNWRPDIRHVVKKDKLRGHEVWEEIWSDGTGISLEEAEKIDKRRSVRCVVSQGGEVGGCWTYEIVARNPGAVLMITEALTVHKMGFRLWNTEAGRKKVLDGVLVRLGGLFGEESPRLGDTMVDVSRPVPAAETPTE